MTPPAKASGEVTATASGSANPPVTPKPADKQAAAKPAAKEEYVVDESPEMQIVPSGSIMMGPTEQGGINGKPFSIDSQSNWGDYFTANINGAVLFDLFGFGGANKAARFRLGPRIDFNHTRGNENTGGSNYNQITLSPQIELDWTRAWGTGLGGVLKGPSYINIWAGLGGGWGTGTAESFSLHDQGGLASTIGLGLNIFNVNVRSLQIGADAAFQTTGIWGDTHNSPQNSFMFGLTFRPGTNIKKVTPPPEEKCEDTASKIQGLVAKNNELRKKNAARKEDLDVLKAALEKGKNPLTSAKIRDALFYREVRLEILKALPNANEEKVRAAIKLAILEKGGDAAADAQLKKGIPGLTDEILTNAKASADKKYPKGYDYWAQITGDPVPTTGTDPLSTDCRELDKLYDDLWGEHVELNKRWRDIEGRFDTAILLDALGDMLGEDVTKFINVYKATVMDFPNPQFKSGHPDDKELARLKEFVDKNKGTDVDPKNSELQKILKPIFANPVFEAEKAKKMADQMNGKIELPGEAEAAAEASKAGKPVPPPDRDWIKNLKFRIEGHTDSVGDDGYNQKLSERRAETEMLLFSLFGVDPTRLERIGYGESRPLVPEVPGAGLVDARTQNRRCVIRINGQIDPSAPLVGQGGGDEVHTDASKIPGVNAEGDPSKKGGAPKKTPEKKPVQPQGNPQPNPPPPSGKKDDKKPGNPIDFGN